jgi:hypothetical protein
MESVKRILLLVLMVFSHLGLVAKRCPHLNDISTLKRNGSFHKDPFRAFWLYHLFSLLNHFL